MIQQEIFDGANFKINTNETSNAESLEINSSRAYDAESETTSLTDQNNIETEIVETTINKIPVESTTAPYAFKSSTRSIIEELEDEKFLDPPSIAAESTTIPDSSIIITSKTSPISAELTSIINEYPTTLSMLVAISSITANKAIVDDSTSFPESAIFTEEIATEPITTDIPRVDALYIEETSNELMTDDLSKVDGSTYFIESTSFTEETTNEPMTADLAIVDNSTSFIESVSLTEKTTSEPIVNKPNTSSNFTEAMTTAKLELETIYSDTMPINFSEKLEASNASTTNSPINKPTISLPKQISMSNDKVTVQNVPSAISEPVIINQPLITPHHLPDSVQTSLNNFFGAHYPAFLINAQVVNFYMNPPLGIVYAQENNENL